MTQRKACTAAVRTDQTGEVFVVLAIQGMRRCFICDQVFSREESARHADIVCWPEMPNGMERATTATKRPSSLCRVMDCWNCHSLHPGLLHPSLPGQQQSIV